MLEPIDLVLSLRTNSYCSEKLWSVFIFVNYLIYVFKFIQGNQTESLEQTNEIKNNVCILKESREITVPDIYEVVQQVWT